MIRLRKNHLHRVGMVALFLSPLGVVLISGYVADRLSQDLELLEQHGAAMRAGTLSADDPFSIPAVQAHVRLVRWITLGITGAVLATIYLSIVTLSWRAARQQRLAAARLEEALSRSNKFAWEAAEATLAKKAFLASMSDQVRTPMNRVIAVAGLLLNTDLDDEQHEYVATVRASGEELLAIINEILDYSRVELRTVDVE